MDRWLLLCIAVLPHTINAQCDRWQQRIAVQLDVELDVVHHSFHGTEVLSYTNNGPDTLHHLFFHLYFNAFKPGSEMDVRSRSIPDPDPRIGARIADLAPVEQGDLRVTRMTQGGRALELDHRGTLLRASLRSPLLPGRTTEVRLDFEGQVPIQIRRSGRDNAESVAYSMTQWYPKVAAYDQRGWHTDPYVAREFYGEWGDHDLRITIDTAYTVAATGELQPPGRSGRKKRSMEGASGKRTWHFVARNVHDVAWAADRDWLHSTAQVPDGPLLHFYYKNDPEILPVWEELPGYMVRSFQYMNTHFGKYPWPVYSFVQGGDGGMEYPMLTLITGKRRLGSLVGVSVHESVHSWYYGALASNEARFPWMDEGFTEYAGSKVMQELFPKAGSPHAGAMKGYLALFDSGRDEPLSVHADHYATNFAYGVNAYSKGEMFLDQLGYVIGEDVLMRGLVRYFNTCKFKHPEPIDVERIMEKESSMRLDWYFDQWMNTTWEPDHAIASVVGVGDSVRIELQRKGRMLMPIDLSLLIRNGTTLRYTIPHSLMWHAKEDDPLHPDAQVLPPWQWTDATYSVSLPIRFGQVEQVVLDPSGRMADTEPADNVVVLPEGSTGFARP